MFDESQRTHNKYRRYFYSGNGLAPGLRSTRDELAQKMPIQWHLKDILIVCVGWETQTQ